MTHRQFLAWQAWFLVQLNVPDRGDYYLMALRNDIHNTGRKKPRTADFDKLKVDISVKERQEVPVVSIQLTEEEVAQGGGYILPPRRLTKKDIEEMHKARAIAIAQRGKKL